MNVSDAGFLYLDRPHAALNIGAVAIVDGSVRREALIARLEQQIAAYPRYRQRPVASPLGATHPRWKDSPGFSVARHVRGWTLPPEAELFQHAAWLVAQPLERDRPLWRMHLVSLADGRTALVQSVHHCMIDGVSGALLLDRWFDSDTSLPGSEPVAGDAESGLSASLVQDLWTAARQPFRLGGEVARALGSGARARAARERLLASAYEAVRLGLRDIPHMPWNAPLGRRRRLLPLQLPFASIRPLRDAFGASTNDVLLSVVAGGLHRYLQATGVATRGLELTALVPVSLRIPGDEDLGNRISAMLVPLATDVEREPARLQVTLRITEQLRARSAWTGIGSLLDLLENVPPWLVRTGARLLPLARVANLVATSVPGPREPRSLLGAPVASIHPIVPIADGLGLGVAAFSYAGQLYVTLHADADLLPDLDKLRLGIEESFAALLAVIGAGGPPR